MTRLIRISCKRARVLALLSLAALPAMQLHAQQTQDNADREWLKRVRIGAYSLSADQGASLPAADVAARMATAQDGEVIIGHINQPHRPSGEGIAQGIINLRRAGFSFVHLDELDPTEYR